MLVEGKVVGLLLTFIDPFDIGRNQVIDITYPLIDLRKGIVIDYWKLSEPKENGGKYCALLF